MSAAVVALVAIALVLCVFFALRAKAKEREDHMFEKIMLAAAGTVTQKNVRHPTMANAGEEAIARPEADVRTMAGMRSMELAMREFAFYCAQYAKSPEAAYDKASVLLEKLESSAFESFVRGSINDFIEAYGSYSPLQRHVKY